MAHIFLVDLFSVLRRLEMTPSSFFFSFCFWGAGRSKCSLDRLNCATIQLLALVAFLEGLGRLSCSGPTLYPCGQCPWWQFGFLHHWSH